MDKRLVRTIKEQLKAPGITKGEPVLAHASLRALGAYPDKAGPVTLSEKYRTPAPTS